MSKKSTTTQKPKRALLSTNKARAAKKASSKVTASAQVTRTQPPLPDQKTTVGNKLTIAAGRSLLVLSPFRFPLDVDKIAIQTARFGGVFFVVLGGIFTLWYANLVFSTLDNEPLAAQTVDSALNTSGDATSLTNTITATRVMDSEQSFNYSVADPLVGRVNVSVHVDERPASVIFRAKNKDTGSVLELGSMKETSGQRWEYLLDTTKLYDAPYRFQALVKYQSATGGSYLVEVTDSNDHTIENDTANTSTETSSADSTSPLTEVSSATTTTSDASITNASDDSTTQNVLSGSIKPFASTVVSGKQSIRVITQGATKVKLHLHQEGVLTPQSLGYATKVSDTEWRLPFETTNHPNATYSLVAVLVDSSNASVKTAPVAFTITNETTTTDSSTTTPQSVVQSESEIEASTNPTITIDVIGPSPLAGTQQVNITTLGATYVELYALPKNAGTLRYVGLPKKADSDLWTYPWNTLNAPNGEYRLVAKVKTNFGIFHKESDWVQVFNEVVVNNTEDDLSYVATLSSIANESAVSEESKDASTDPSITEIPPTPSVVGQEGTQNEAEAPRVAFKAMVDSYRQELDKALQRYALALRSGVPSDIKAAKDRIDEIARKIKDSPHDAEVKNDFIAYVDTFIEASRKRIELDVEKTNILIVERTQTEATKDSDADGISDYDEIALFKTDPHVADSDNDGFTDGAEVLGGYDPTDSRPQVAVAHESPKDAGVLRDDILAVEAITTENFRESGTPDENPVALITGKALPNSFVTLYIYSTPIIVTVKTDAEGGWSYRFDRELENGEHQVYVGITDNAGRIVAKSNPLTFVKEAQAYTAVAAPVPVAIVENDARATLFSGTVLFMVASISVVALGLVLILLGIHMDARRKNFFIAENGEAIPRA